jgi:hypothetical protein
MILITALKTDCFCHGLSQQFQGAFAAVIKPNSSKTWKKNCFPCLDAEEIFLASVIIQVSPMYAKIRQGFTKQVKARRNHTNCHACS